MPALFTQQKADLPTEVENQRASVLVLHTESAPAAMALDDAILLTRATEQSCSPFVSYLLTEASSAMAEFPPCGGCRFRYVLALTVPVARGLSPFLLHRCLTLKRALRQAATPDQQAIFIFHFIIGIQGNKVNPRSGLFPRETTIAYRFRQKRLLRHLTKQPLSTVSCRLLSLIL